jgi:transcriptional regulator of heat shock response
MALTERAARILEASIQEFIRTGEPVSSGWLFDHYDFGIRPAMIRLELDVLEGEGYLEQPHHSAGRVPTDAGYEFFARQSLQSGAVRDAGPHDRFERRALPALLHELSAELGLLSIAADLARDMVYKTGLEELVNHFDWEDHEAIRSVIRDFENVDERLPRATEKLEGAEGPQIFIGRKSPVTKSENLSVVCGTYKIRGETVCLFAIGPKRMDYRKVIRIFRNL